jgi:hypothetical protein
MAGDAARSPRKRDVNQPPGNLREAVEALRKRFSSITVETSVVGDETSLWIGFLGDEANLRDRQLLVRSFAEVVPQGFSVIGVMEQKQRSEETRPDDKAA